MVSERQAKAQARAWTAQNDIPYARARSILRWPSDVHVAIDSQPRPLLELLFLRSAWSLPANREVLEIDPELAPGNRPSPSAPTSKVRVSWDETWRSRLMTYAHINGESSPRAPHAVPGGVDRRKLILSLHGDPHSILANIDRNEFERWVRLVRQDDFGLAAQVRRSEVLLACARNGLRQILILPLLGDKAFSPGPGLVIAPTRMSLHFSTLECELAGVLLNRTDRQREADSAAP